MVTEDTVRSYGDVVSALLLDDEMSFCLASTDARSAALPSAKSIR